MSSIQGSGQAKVAHHMHPAVRILGIVLLITFFGGGALIFVNNLIVSFLPNGVEAVLGGIILIMFIVMYVVSKCVSGVKAVRELGLADTRPDQPGTNERS